MEKIGRRFFNVKKSKTFNNLVNTLNLDKKPVLDIGCSFGEFLINFGKGSLGVTITKEEAEYGKQNNLNIQLCNIEEDDSMIPHKSFDVIFANNIFEHLISPHLFLIRTRKYLKDDGILILGVPCIPKIVSLLKINKFRGSMAEAHINFFTKETLKYTAKRGGVERFINTQFSF